MIDTSAIYPSLYILLQTHIYGATELTPDMTLTLTFLATLGTLFMVALPFIVAWRVIKLWVG